MKKLIPKNSQKGFTVVETLVAITILLLSIIGPMEIAAKGLFAAIYAKDEITAFYLGQEAIEYVRNARDTNYLADYYSAGELPDETDSMVWLSGLTECAPPIGCMINVREQFRLDSNNSLNENAILQCDADAGCPALHFDEDTGLYDYDSNNGVSKFTRTVTVTPFPNKTLPNEEALIEVKISWSTGFLLSVPKTFTIRERILNWQRK